jgi:RNA polymerase sigma-70 factor (ECF subfamily)
MSSPITPDDSFDADLQRARSGDRKSLDRLLQMLEARFRRDAERRVGTALRGRTRVSDVLQDAYLEVVRGISRFQGSGQGEFYVWVTTIVENTARRLHRQLTAQKRKPPSRTTEWNALAAAILPSVSSPLSELEHSENARLLHDALQQLTEDHRHVLEQCVLLGRPFAELCEEMGRSEPALRMLAARARAALTSKLYQLRSDQSR